MPSEPLDEDTIRTALTGLEGWTHENGALRRSHEAESFPAAIRLVDEVALLAEEADHHPDIDIRWRTVHFALSTHEAGDGITGLDLELARQINALLRG
jgi:4a-hydroxytetrahydrobiopterin dehydratase